MKTILGTALAVLCLLAAPVPTASAWAAEAALQVTGAWARATPPNAQAGAAFLTIANTGAEGDRLLAARAPVAKSVELHLHMDVGGIMQMRPVEAIDLRPGQTVTLEPGGLHVMLIGPTKPLKAGDSFPLTLVFEQAGELTVPVEVMGVGAMGPGAMRHDPQLHQQHMQDPAHREMHQRMHGDGNQGG